MKFIVPTNLSEQDVELRDRMGEEIYGLYHCLHDDLLLIVEKWTNYKFLYVDQHTFDRVGSQAGRFFLLVEDALKNDIVLSIARLFDTQSRNSRNSLSFWRLREAVRNDRPSKSAILMKVIIPLPSSMQSLRDKLLAHRDYASMQQNSVSALDVADIEDRIQMMSNALNVVRSCYDSDSSVEYGGYSTGDTRTLIGEIGIAYRFRAYLEKNFLERDIFPEELLHVLHGSTLPVQH